MYCALFGYHATVTSCVCVNSSFETDVMPKYRFAAENKSESDYESDGGTRYYSRTPGHYKLADLSTSRFQYHYGYIYIQIVDKYLQYVLSNHQKKTVSGSIQMIEFNSDLSVLLDEIQQAGLIPTFNRYLPQLIDATIKNGHTRKGDCGRGSYSAARHFRSDTNKTKIILDPVSTRTTDYSESLQKYRFFTKMYPNEGVAYHRGLFTYRMVVPEVPGVQYQQLNIIDTTQQIQLFISMIKALQHCHSTGLVFLDLQEQNIFYESPTSDEKWGVSHLIDGGLSITSGENLPVEIFKKKDQETLRANMDKYDWFAPECWSITGVSTAHPSMDIYSMAITLRRVLREIAPELQPLIKACTMTDPQQRPSLADLESSLKNMLAPACVNGFN